MPDPIEKRLRSLADYTTTTPPPPSDIHRRGDRLRRRNHSLALASGAMVLGLVAVPVLNLAGGGKSTTPPPVTTSSGVTGDDLLTVADLPTRNRLADWEQAVPNGATLACLPSEVVGELAAEDVVDRRFGAHIADSPASGPYASEIRETVLEFGSEDDARAAHQSVASWINDCAAPDLVGKTRHEQHPVSGAGAVGFWELFLRSADKVCFECDAIRFDRQAAVRIDTRLVLLSLNEIGGPLEPEGLDQSMKQLVNAAVTKAAPHGDPDAGQSPTS